MKGCGFMVKLKSYRLAGKKSDIIRAMKYNMILNLQNVERDIECGAITYDLDSVLQELNELYG